MHPHPGQSRGLSTTTVHGIHTTLHHALKSAVDQRLLPNNPADHVEPPKIAHKAMTILNDEQLDIFMNAIKQGPIWYDFFYTALTTGLRLGEICGLMWSDFDGRKGTLSTAALSTKKRAGVWWQATPRPMPGPERLSCLTVPQSCCETARSIPTPYGSSTIRCGQKPR